MTEGSTADIFAVSVSLIPMAGLGSAINAFFILYSAALGAKTWVAGPSPATGSE
jgi:hypothetical protein